MRNIVILNSLAFSYPLPVLMRVEYNSLIVKLSTSNYHKYKKSREKTGICSQFSGAHPIFYKDRCGIARKDFRAKILSVALKI